MRARFFVSVLVGMGLLLGLQSVLFVPKSTACLPGFKPKPGVTNPQDNARDCEPVGSPSPPPSGPSAPSSAPSEPTETKRRKTPPVVPPSMGRQKAEELLRERFRGSDEPVGPQQPRPPAPRRPDEADEAIKRLGDKLKRGSPARPPGAQVPPPLNGG